MYLAKGIGSRSRNGNLEVTDTRQVGSGEFGVYVTIREMYGVTRKEDIPLAAMRRLARATVPDANRCATNHTWVSGGCGHVTFYLHV
jgi:hypothetical protein